MNDTASVKFLILSSDMKKLPNDKLSYLLRSWHITAFSSGEVINVTSDGSSYLVVFWDEDISQVDPKVIAVNVASLFMDSLKGYDVKLSIHYFKGPIKDDDIPNSFFESIINLHNEFTRNFSDLDNGVSKFHYIPSSSIDNAYREYVSRTSIPDGFKDIQKKPSVKKDYPVTWMNGIGIPGIDSDDIPTSEDDVFSMFDILDEYEPPKNKSKKSKKKSKISYGRSRVLRAANNPKRAYRRHGVIVCTEKDAIKKDEKVIKEFLKDFIPGDAEWKKDFRKDLLKRWMNLYVITKKQLKYFEKNMHKQVVRNRTNANVERTLNITRQLFNVPIDQWNNPNK